MAGESHRSNNHRGAKPGSPGVFHPLSFALFLLISGVAGFHLGGWSQRLFWLTAGLGILSTGLTCITRFTLRFSQEFSTDHPRKGSTVLWTIRVSNPLAFWTTDMEIQGFPIPGTSVYPGPGLIPPLNPRETRTFEKQFVCKYRGVYNLGLATIKIIDPLLGFRLQIPVTHRNFYVLPEIYRLKDQPSHLRGQSNSTLFQGDGASFHEPASFRGIEEYSPGYSTSRIHWQSLARYNRPMITSYDGRTQRFSVVILDTRSLQSTQKSLINDEWKVPSEDAAVETYFSLLYGLTRAGLPFESLVPGWVSGNHEHQNGGTHRNDRGEGFNNPNVEEMLIRSNSLFFDWKGDLKQLLENSPLLHRATECYLVSPSADSSFIEISEFITTRFDQGAAILCACGYPEAHPGLSSIRTLSMEERYLNRVSIIDNPREIPEKVFLL